MRNTSDTAPASLDTPAPSHGPSHRPASPPPRMRLHVSHRGPWMQFRSPHDFEWTAADLEIPSLPPALDGLRIVHVTDFHIRSYWADAYDHLIQRIHAAAPDLILLTGDFVESKRNHRPALPFVQRLLTAITARLGVYAILGNHDGDLLSPRLADWNITTLNSRHLCLHSHDAEIDLIGMPGPERSDMERRVSGANFIASVPPKSDRAVRIVLSHYPDHLSYAQPLRPDIVLAGHTHGGQICLPGGFPLITHDSLPRRFCKGIHWLHNTWLVVNRGFGFSGFLPIRLFCPAEAIELRLIRKQP